MRRELEFMQGISYRRNEDTMKQDFKLYANPKTKKINEDGMVKMGETLGIDIYNDTFITFFFFCCGMKNLEEVTEEQYLRGLAAFKSNRLSEVKNYILYVREELLDISSKSFREFYMFLFEVNYIKKTKMIPYEAVEVYFDSFFCDSFPVCRKLKTFLKDVKKVQGLDKDQWECILDLLLNLGTTFPDGYQCEDYYNSLYDEFYTWYLEQESKGK